MKIVPIEAVNNRRAHWTYHHYMWRYVLFLFSAKLEEYMNLIFSRYSKFPPFLMFPKFLDEIEDLTDTDKRVYIEIFNRMRISLQNENWIDRNGNVFVVYKIDQLTKQLHKSSSTIKASLSKLEEKDLILRKHRGVGRPNYIYIKVPKEIKRPKNCPPQSQNSDFHMDDILNLKINNRNMINNERIHINADDSIPPTLDQIIEYNKAKGLDIDCEAFYYYYSANG